MRKLHDVDQADVAFTAFYATHVIPVQVRPMRKFLLGKPALALLEVLLLSDAEGSEDKVQDVVGRGGAGDLVQSSEGIVEIEKDHLMRCV